MSTNIVWTCCGLEKSRPTNNLRLGWRPHGHCGRLNDESPIVGTLAWLDWERTVTYRAQR